jgi:excinuclease ABC subunit B
MKNNNMRIHKPFNLKHSHTPMGDQPTAIASLTAGIEKGLKHQTLLGATGTGKTFTIANVIQKVQKPTLVIAHNKTLAAQLAQEFKEFFPDNEVHYFVSYYDYYQPEAYMSGSDTYIEKEAQVNEEIDRLRHASTQALLTRDDVIIVSSVSCIYGLGSPKQYLDTNFVIKKGDIFDRNEIAKRLIQMQFSRTTADLGQGQFRIVGNNIEIMPIHERIVYRLIFKMNKVETIEKIDHITRVIIENDLESVFIFPAKHFMSSDEDRLRAVQTIKKELDIRLDEFQKEDGKEIEYQRLKRRTTYDLSLIREMGYCNGIENYSRHFSGKKAGEAPDTLISYFPEGFLTVIDESHVTVPQIGAMYAGDASRKKNLIDFGFRLPSAADNRPLKFDEFEGLVDQTIYVSATPGKFEYEVCKKEDIIQQIIRPTGLVDPKLEVKPIVSKGDYPGQIYDFIKEVQKTIKKGERVLATTLTKKMAEDLTDFLKEKNIKTRYLHSDVETLERIQILTELRKGEFDVLVGVNLLREGLDLPEVSLIGILDADKEGFLRSRTALIQTIGRAARNVDGRVILYADRMTDSLKYAIDETDRRRAIQETYNKKHKITPTSIKKNIQDITSSIESMHEKTVKRMLAVDIDVDNVKDIKKKDLKIILKRKEKEMEGAVKELDFETAAILRDEIKAIEKMVEGKK